MLHALDPLTVYPLAVDLILATIGAAIWLFWLVVFTAAPIQRLWTRLVRRFRQALAERRTT